MSLGELDEETLLHMLSFAVTRRKRDLAELAKPHPMDDKAGERVAKAILEHVRLCGCDIVNVRQPNQFMPPSSRRKDDETGD